MEGILCKNKIYAGHFQLFILLQRQLVDKNSSFAHVEITLRACYMESNLLNNDFDTVDRISQLLCTIRCR